MSDIPIYVQLLACGSFMLLGVSVASATAQYLRSQQTQAARVAVRRPANR